LVEKYFASLADIDSENEVELTPTVKKLSGVLRPEPDFDIKDEKVKRLLENTNDIRDFYRFKHNS
jgi:hypothetical protein